MTKNYIKPEVDIIAVHLEGAVLSESLTTGGSTGENINWGDEFDPWN
jgi:hypothetical protein